MYLPRHIRSVVAVILAVVAVVWPGGAAGAGEDGEAEWADTVRLPGLGVDSLLDALDATLSANGRYEEAKAVRIGALRKQLYRATDRDQCYWLARDLYEEYCSFDSDSALHYAAEAYRHASAAGRRDWMDEMQIDRSYVLAATGLLNESDDILKGINPGRLPRDIQMRFYEQALFLSTHRDQFIGIASTSHPYDAAAAEMLDSLCRKLTPDDPQYLWFAGWRSILGPEVGDEVLARLKKSVDSSALSTRRDAMDAWSLSRLYERRGDPESKLRYLIMSAIADVRACNREIASLEEVANIMYDSRDSLPGSSYDNLKRANDYISYCIRCANLYKSRVRVGRLAELQHQISQSYQTELARQEHRGRVYLRFLGAILLGLLGALGFIIFQMKKLHRSRRLLNDANRELSDKVDELEDLKTKLEEANTTLAGMYSDAREGARGLAQTNQAKEKYIADIFAMCSNYISKLDDFRKGIHRRLIAGKYEDLRQLTKSPDLPLAEVQELQRTFDETFLSIYPDFVEDFNTLLREDARIVPKKSGRLNTELRIYALVRLGITDSTSIARFLHCSVQTVYNTRQRVRDKAAVPREGFAERVRSLGKPDF